MTVRFVDKQALNFPMIVRVSYFCRVQAGRRIQWKKKMAVTSDGTRDVTAHALSVCVFCFNVMFRQTENEIVCLFGSYMFC